MARTMKDSGVEWIGKIPEGWNVIKGRYCFDVQSGFPFESDKFSITKGFPLIRIRDITSGVIETFYDGDYSNDYVVNQGDFLIGMDGDFNVRLWNERPALLNQRCCRITEKNGYNRKFLFYVLPFQLDLVNQLTYSTTVKHLAVPDLHVADVPSPSIKVQQRIADFLDKKCAAIDDVLAKTQESIEEYKKLKQAIITEAVTKGVRGKRPLKDSGIDWIGQIPKEWNSAKIKQVSSRVTDGAHISPETEHGVYDFVSTVDVDSCGNIDFEHCLKTSKQNYLQLVANNCKPKLDDVLISKDGTVGRTAIVKDDHDFVVSSSLVIISPLKKMMTSKFLNYNLQARYIQESLTLLMHGAGLKRVSIEKNANLPILLPPLSEQQEIAAYLDSKCASIDTLIAKKQQFIDELTQYKKSLIYEYVTGKKEVPA